MGPKVPKKKKAGEAKGLDGTKNQPPQGGPREFPSHSPARPVYKHRQQGCHSQIGTIGEFPGGPAEGPRSTALGPSLHRRRRQSRFTLAPGIPTPSRFL